MEKENIKKYALTAAAVLGVATYANATVQYSGVQNVFIDTGANSNIDIDGDGTSDFNFQQNHQLSGSYNTSYIMTNNLFLNPVNSNSAINSYVTLGTHTSVVARLNDTFNVTGTLPAGDTWRVNNHQILGQFHKQNIMISSTYTFSAGGFGNFLGQTGCIGVRFQIGGATHFGWVQVRGGAEADNMTIIDWAYEDQPNTAITACEVPATETEPTNVPILNPMGIAALIGLISASGIGVLRRKEDD